MNLPAHCCTTTNDSRIKVEQRGRKAIFVNEGKLTYVRVEVDGCVIKNAKAADFIVSRSDIGDVIIELKGRDVAEAVKQVEATAKYWVDNKHCNKKIAALIVSTQFPKTSTAVLRAKDRFRKTYGTPLHVVTKNYEGSVEAIFSARGPHRV
jgi:hypothetical protein